MFSPGMEYMSENTFNCISIANPWDLRIFTIYFLISTFSFQYKTSLCSYMFSHDMAQLTENVLSYRADNIPIVNPCG